MPAFMLVVGSNAVPGQEKAYDEWYVNQHIPDLLNIPGIVAAQRLALLDGYKCNHKYLALYQVETDDPGEVMAELVKRSNTPLMPISPALDLENAVFRMYQCTTPWVKKKS